jgi:hypothetical protein
VLTDGRSVGEVTDEIHNVIRARAHAPS